MAAKENPGGEHPVPARLRALSADERAAPPGELTPPGLVRERLVGRLLDPRRYSVARVVAPAGSGKSRLLSHVARLYPGPLAWCGSPDPVPRTEGALAAWISRAMVAEEESSTLARTIDELVRYPYPPDEAPVLVVLDDVHLLEDSDAESALSELASRAPSWMRLLVAGRVSLAMDLSRLRVSGLLVDIDQDDLRFRTWEIEELFRDVYQDPLIPEDVGALARRTGGWAAYLQLFHLATARKPQAVRREVLSTLSTQSRLVREYLSRHVLAELTPQLQDFLIRTSVLRRPTPELCDELLGGDSGSFEKLDELERRHLFTERREDGSYRYHTVLLSYLDAVLVETLGISAARDCHHHAARLLERSGFIDEATAAFARAEDWMGVARLLGYTTGPAAAMGDAWLEALPPTVIEADSMLLLARARRALGSGALEEAVRITRQAEQAAASAAVGDRCRAERERLLAWASADRVAQGMSEDWSILLRIATQRDPAGVRLAAASLPGPQGRFVEGLAALMSGDVVVAGRILASVSTHPDAPQWMVAAACLASLTASSAAGKSAEEAHVERVRDEIESAGVPWLLRVAGVTLMLSGRGSDDVSAELLDACRREGDRWGEAIVALAGGVASLAAGTESTTLLDLAVQGFTDLGAGVYAATAAGYYALASWHRGDAREVTRAAAQARTLGAALEVPVACALAELATGVSTGDPNAIERAKVIFERLGSWAWHAELAGLTAPAPNAHSVGVDVRDTAKMSSDAAPPAVLRCLGGFSLSIAGRAVDETAAKPMERSLLHLLALRAGERVHREELIEAMWPEADPDAGRHRLQVAISSLRRLLSDGSDSPTMLVRDGDTYRLSLPPESDVDIWHVEHELKAATAARSRSDDVAEAVAIGMALASYAGHVLPMDGPAEWAVGPRVRLQVALADAAARLSAIRRNSGDLSGAAEAARRGLEVDRFRDDLWRLLIDAAERSGHRAEAGKARQSYAEVLEELGA